MLRNIGSLLAMTLTAAAMVLYVLSRTRWGSGLLKAARSRRNRRQAPVPTAAGTMQRRFAQPAQCVYWRNPELVRAAPMKEGFELIDTYAKESHLTRYLLKCPECGQLYFFEFYEWVDWEHGNDPQYSKYIPVPSVGDAQMLRKATQAELLLFSPSLNIDFPRDADAPKIYWAGKGSS
jgi:phage terminase large subunit GpA-like protein